MLYVTTPLGSIYRKQVKDEAGPFGKPTKNWTRVIHVTDELHGLKVVNLEY